MNARRIPDGAEAREPCAHAHHRQQNAADALAAADRLCRERGLRMTPIRRAVLEALHATHAPVGAYDLIEALAPTGTRRLPPISIYRALDFLIEHGLVHRLASRNAFVACPHQHDGAERIAFLICDRCGGVDEIASSELDNALGRLFADHHFTPRLPVLEVAGRCGHCQAGPPEGAWNPDATHKGAPA